MMDIGRLCVKIAGRDADNKCVIIKILDDNFVLIDGATRRKRCNLVHLEPLDQKIDIKEDASHEEVVSAFKALGIEVVDKKSKPKKDKPKKVRKVKVHPADEPKKVKKAPAEKKEAPKKTTKPKKEKAAQEKAQAPAENKE
jgi:large subunit ribosomal protein L14e